MVQLIFEKGEMVKLSFGDPFLNVSFRITEEYLLDTLRNATILATAKAEAEKERNRLCKLLDDCQAANRKNTREVETLTIVRDALEKKVRELANAATRHLETIQILEDQNGQASIRTHQEYENNLRVHTENRILVDALTKFHWRPIETAPKNDGRVILIAGDIGIENQVRVAYWAGSRQAWLSPCSDYLYYPSHWMPLPAFPPFAK